jgi:geranylgeranyl diphosphate synthase type II
MQMMVQENVALLLAQTAREVDAALRQRMVASDGAPPRLVEAMRYSLEAGGKRFRPALVLWSCEMCGGRREAAMAPALAVECVHTFSLIHDDLPAIDNDEMRRGRPASHRKFGEALAILAGDALATLAFEIIANDVNEPTLAAAMVKELSAATGWKGMIGGEVADLEGQSHAPDEKLVAEIHAAKTARLIEASCRLGGIAARAEPSHISALGRYGRHLGLAFQAADDLLDISGRSEKMGKASGKDHPAGKQTYPRAVGMEASVRLARTEADQAAEALAPFGEAAAGLRELARFVVEREA